MSNVVYVVVYAVGGYAREDADTPECGGVYTDFKQAQLHAKVIHGRVAAITLDYMPPGIAASAKELGLA